jgi:hypothetical protein
MATAVVGSHVIARPVKLAEAIQTGGTVPRAWIATPPLRGGSR